MEKKLRGIVVGVKDYANDKMITILSAEEGLVNILVETSSSQPIFTYAKELLTFGNFFVTVKGSFFCVLEKCEVVDAFMPTKNNSAKFCEAVNLCGAVKELAQYNDQDTPLFLEFMEALKILNYHTVQPNLVIAKFLSSVFQGFSKKLDFKYCSLCGEKLQKTRFINLENATFVCPNCQNKNTICISAAQFKNLATLIDAKYESLPNLHIEGLGHLVGFLFQIYHFKVAERFKFYSE